MTDRLRAFPALALTIAATALAGCGPTNLVRGLANPGRLGLCGLAVVVLDVLALVEVWKSSRADSDKILWTVVIVIFPFVGLLAYYFVGRK